MKSEWNHQTVKIKFNNSKQESLDDGDHTSLAEANGVTSYRKQNHSLDSSSCIDQWNNDMEPMKQSEDEFQIFGNYIASLMRNVPNIADARRMQRRITSFALQCVEECDP